MTTGSETYLAIILATFLVYAGTLFWEMITSNGGPNTRPRVMAKPHYRDREL